MISRFVPTSSSDRGAAGLWVGAAVTIAVSLMIMAALFIVPLITNTTQQIGSLVANGLVCSPNADAEQPDASGYAMDSIPENYLELYIEAGEDRGVPWNILAGIGQVESHHGRWDGPGITEGHNDWGAAGPMLFDLAADIGEQHDLLAAKPEVAKDLQARYDTWNATLEKPRWGQPNRQLGTFKKKGGQNKAGQKKARPKKAPSRGPVD